MNSNNRRNSINNNNVHTNNNSDVEDIHNVPGNDVNNKHNSNERSYSLDIIGLNKNNDDKIGTLCHLIGIATQADINNFYEKKNRTEDINDIVDNDLSGDSSSDDILEIPDEIDETDSKNISNLKQDQEEDDETDTIKNFIVI